jgi:hypothetical protein
MPGLTLKPVLGFVPLDEPDVSLLSAWPGAILFGSGGWGYADESARLLAIIYLLIGNRPAGCAYGLAHITHPAGVRIGTHFNIGILGGGAGRRGFGAGSCAVPASGGGIGTLGLSAHQAGKTKYGKYGK